MTGSETVTNAPASPRRADRPQIPDRIGHDPLQTQPVRQPGQLEGEPFGHSARLTVLGVGGPDEQRAPLPVRLEVEAAHEPVPEQDG